MTFSVLICGAPHVSAAEDIACEIKHNLHHDNTEIRSFYQLIMKNNSGVIMINGEVYQGRKEYIISREINFIYQRRSGNDYKLISSIIHKNPIDNIPDILFKAHYPNFFLKKIKY